MDTRQYMQPYQMHNTSNMQQLCQQHLNRRVRAVLCDGKMYEGLVEHVDDQHVYLIIEININVTRSEDEEEESRYFGGYGYPPYGPFGYGYPGYGYPGYGYPWYAYPRYGYGRLILPLAALTALSLL